MEQTVGIFEKRNQKITLTTTDADGFIIDVIEHRHGKVILECQIIKPDLEKFIRRRKQEKYTYRCIRQRNN